MEVCYEWHEQGNSSGRGQVAGGCSEEGTGECGTEEVPGGRELDLEQVPGGYAGEADREETLAGLVETGS